MSQTAKLRELDAEIAGHMIAAGLADEGIYVQGSASLACRVYVDLGIEEMGEDNATVAVNVIRITMLLEDVPAPERGAKITVDGETYQLSALVLQDQSQSTWIAVSG